MEWRAYELHPETPFEGTPSPPKTVTQAQGPSLAEQMAAEAGLPMAKRALRSNVRLALEAAEYARAKDVFEPFHREVFAAYWQRGENISDPKVLMDVGRRVGLVGREVLAALAEKQFTDVVDEQLQEARLRGIDSVPAFVFNGKFMVKGVGTYDIFQKVMEEYVLKDHPPT